MRIAGNRRRPLARVCAITAALMLGGCAIAPRSGPTSQALASAAAAPQEADVPFAFAPLDMGAIETLERRRLAPEPELTQTAGGGAARLRTGDVVNVTIWEAVEGGIFSSSVVGGPRAAALAPQRIGPSGTISVPYAGRIAAAGRSTQAVEEAIAAALQGKAIEPQVIVTLAESPVSSVTVVGDAAQRGGRVPLNDVGERVLDVIAAAGGASGPAHATLIRLTRGDAVAETHLPRLLREPAQNVRVRPGDVIAVVRSAQTYTVFGAAGAPARLPFSGERMTLDEALAEAGGLDDRRAEPQSVYVFRYEEAEVVEALTGAPQTAPMAPMVFNLDLSEPSAFFLARRFEIADGDILYVANAPLADGQKVLNAVATALTPVIATLRLANEF